MFQTLQLKIATKKKEEENTVFIEFKINLYKICYMHVYHGSCALVYTAIVTDNDLVHTFIPPKNTRGSIRKCKRVIVYALCAVCKDRMWVSLCIPSFVTCSTRTLIRRLPEPLYSKTWT